MPMEMLKPAEAAIVAHIDIRDVNRVIDERIFPREFVATEPRGFSVAACVFASFYFSSASSLTAERRLSAIREVGARLGNLRGLTFETLSREECIVRDGFLTIDLAPFAKSTVERNARLIAAREMVVHDREILGGAPIIRGTRIPVHDVAASVAKGVPMARILAAYPLLDAEKVGLAAIYASAYPVRGRPRLRDRLPVGAKIVSEGRVPRRRPA
ncbi:MAG: DUF433 domain-containing protein [Proteobacteria bacterium]|nr:DUF433 domain-containing protein [Pseudomonadota bacterium]